MPWVARADVEGSLTILAEELAEHTVRAGSQDNVSVVVILFRNFWDERPGVGRSREVHEIGGAQEPTCAKRNRRPKRSSLRKGVGVGPPWLGCAVGSVFFYNGKVFLPGVVRSVWQKFSFFLNFSEFKF